MEIQIPGRGGWGVFSCLMYGVMMEKGELSDCITIMTIKNHEYHDWLSQDMEEGELSDDPEAAAQEPAPGMLRVTPAYGIYLPHSHTPAHVIYLPQSWSPTFICHTPLS